MKDNTRYKDANEIRAGVYHEITAKNKPQCTKCGKCHGKKRKTVTLLTRSIEGAAVYTILWTIVSQRYMYNKGEIISERNWEKEARTKLGKEVDTNFPVSMILKKKKNQKKKTKKKQNPKTRQNKQTNKNVNAAYRRETESEQEELYTVKENIIEGVFANIDWVDSDRDKLKIKMKGDTNGNIIPLRIYEKKKKNVPTRRQQQNGKTERHKNGGNYPKGSKQYGSVILKIKLKDS